MTANQAGTFSHLPHSSCPVSLTTSPTASTRCQASFPLARLPFHPPQRCLPPLKKCLAPSLSKKWLGLSKKCLAPWGLLAVGVAFLLSGRFCHAEVPVGPTRPGAPNVLVVITDDQGYGDLSCHGNPVLKTPHLDRLAAESVRLTDFHVAPMCTPTRGQLLSGRDAFRNGAMNVSSGRTLLRSDLKTVADVFRAAGYRTGMFGKWHLGDNYPFRPIDRGFEHALWFPSSHINAVPDYWDNDYFADTYLLDPVASDSPDGRFLPDTLAKRRRYSGYCTDVFFREATDWIKQPSDQPFFCYLALNAPHWPHFVPGRYRESMARRVQEQNVGNDLPAGVRETLVRFLAMISCIDENIGMLLEELDNAGLRDDTIVVFLTDNGSTMGPRYFNANMRGGKTRLWEGGHRVPCFVSWPGGNLSPFDCDGLCHVQDLFPTLTQLAGIEGTPSDLDGIDLSAALRQESVIPERKLVINYSRMPNFREQYTDQPHVPQKNGAAVLWNRWRWIENRQLFHLEQDPLQTQDVADRHPEVVQAMSQHLDDWWSEVQPIVMEPQRVVVGSQYENPSLLTACEWLDVFVDQQVQIRAGVNKVGAWHLTVDRPGTYMVELRRWPRESQLKLTEGMPATPVTDGEYRAGKKLPITQAALTIDGTRRIGQPTADGQAVVFELEWEAGDAVMQAEFLDEQQQVLCGAYYAYIERREP